MLTKGFASGLRSLRMGLVLFAAMLLVNCGGGGGGSAAIPNADVTGYYTNTGEFQHTGNAGDLNIIDLQGMINHGRIMMFSQAKGVGYDGTITVSGNSITGSLIQYKLGGDNTNVTLNATFKPADHSIAGTMSVSADSTAAAFSASFKLNYASGRPASTVTDIADVTTTPSRDWSGYIFASTANTLALTLSDNATGAADVTTLAQNLSIVDSKFSQCDFGGIITPTAGSLYSADMALKNCFYGAGLNNNPLQGMAAVRGTTLVVMAVDKTGLTSDPQTNFGFFAEFN